MSKTREKYLEIATEIVDEVSGYLLDRFGNIKEMWMKEDNNPSIGEDKESDLLYERFLQKTTPEVGLFTEEGGKDMSHDLTWVIDSIEGTSNYRAGIPFFATQICLLDKGIPAVAVLDAPCYKMRFSAIVGEGTFLNGKRVMVGNEILKRSLISVDRGGPNDWAVEIMKKLSGQVRTMRWFGASGLNMALVASGGIDLFVNKGSQLYDYAAGVLLVREAGGVVWNFSGNDWSVNDREMLAGNGQIVKEGLELIG